MYNDTKYADSIIGRNVHITSGCVKIDASGTVERYEIYNNEIIYVIRAHDGHKAHIGTNSPDFMIEVLD